MTIVLYIIGLVAVFIVAYTIGRFESEQKKQKEEPKHTYTYTEPTKCIKCKHRKISRLSSNYLCNSCEDAKWGY